jgi:hypothetical protein
MLAIQNNKDGRPIMLQSLNAASSAPPSPPLGPEEDLNTDLSCDLSCFSAVKVDETNKGKLPFIIKLHIWCLLTEHFFVSDIGFRTSIIWKLAYHK